MKMFWLKLTVFLITLSKILCSSKVLFPLVPSESYTRSAVIDPANPNNFVLLWKLINNNQEIQFEVHCKTTGWVGIGISPTGAMSGSDIGIGWVMPIGSFLKDTHSPPTRRPLTDNIQDWFLLDALEVDGYTILKMKRKLVTGDVTQDLDIINAPQNLIFAWNDQDPVTGLDDWAYHGPSQRYNLVINLLA